MAYDSRYTPQNYYYNPNNPNNTQALMKESLLAASTKYNPSYQKAASAMAGMAAQQERTANSVLANTPANQGIKVTKANSGGGGSVAYEPVYYEAPSYDASAAINDQYNELLAQSRAANQRVLDALKANFDNSTKNINANYDLQQKTSEQDSADALRQAYINYMMSRRNINNDLARAGYTGGLAESNKARMFNNYGTNRNAIRTLLAQNLEKINTARNAELNDVQSQYDTALANQWQKYYDREMAIRQNLANALLSI